MRFKLFVGLAIIGANLVCTGISTAESTDNLPRELRVVLRISKDLIRKHVRPTIQEETPIDQYVMGSHAVGSAKTNGKIAVKLEAHDTESTFVVRFEGTTRTDTVASRFPVDVYTTGTARFHARRVINFDGERFTARSSTIEATYSSTLDGIGTLPGLRGCIVRTFATPIVRRQMPQADALALRDTKSQILTQFDAQSDKLVTELNNGLPARETIEFLAPTTRDWITHLGTTQDFLIVSRGPRAARLPELPKEAADLRAGVELWIHGKPESEKMRRVVDIWTKAYQLFDRFRSKKVDRSKQIEVKVEGDWLVIRVGEDLLDHWFDKLLE